MFKDYYILPFSGQTHISLFMSQAEWVSKMAGAIAPDFGKNEMSGKDTKWSSWKKLRAGHQTWSSSFPQFIYMTAGVEMAPCAIVDT